MQQLKKDNSLSREECTKEKELNGNERSKIDIEYREEDIDDNDETALLFRQLPLSNNAE